MACVHSARVPENPNEILKALPQKNSAKTGCWGRVQGVWQKTSAYLAEINDMSSTWPYRFVSFVVDLWAPKMMTTKEWENLQRRSRRGGLDDEERDSYKKQLSLRDERVHARRMLLESDFAPFLPSNRCWIEDQWTCP